MTVRAKMKQAEIGRALREAHKIGAKRVMLSADGRIDIVLSDRDLADPLHDGQQHEAPGPIRIRRHTKKRMEF